MARDEAATTTGGAAVAEREERPAVIPPVQAGRDEMQPAEAAPEKEKDADEELEYEVEFATPFGKLEFEFEPITRKKKKDAVKKAQAEEKAAKKAAAAALKAQEKAAKRGGRGLLGTLFIVLVVMAIIGATIALAYWLFARPGEEEAIPPEFANEPVVAEPQGFVQKARSRMQRALRAGRQASREAQREQEQRFREMAG